MAKDPNEPKATTETAPYNGLARQLGADSPHNPTPDELEEGLRAIQSLARNLPPQNYFGKGGIRETLVGDKVEKAADSSEKTSVAEGGKTSDHEHHPTTKTLDYLGLGVILAPAPEVIAMYLRHEDIDWQRVAISFVASTIIGSAILWFAHGWRKPVGAIAALRGRINSADDYFAVRAAIIAFFMIAPVLIAPLISGPPSTPSAQPGFTQQEVDGKISAALANVNSQLAQVTQQRDAARREADSFRQKIENAPPPPPAPEDQIPVNWRPDFRFTWYAGPKIAWLMFDGVSSALAHIKDAYIISILTGHKETLEFANATNLSERWKIDQVEPIPPGAAVILAYEPKPSPSLSDFMSQWGAFEFHVVYDNKEYVKTYSQDYMNSKMTREMPGIFGPRVTPRGDK